MASIVLCTVNAKWIHPSLALRLLKANLPSCLASDSVIIEFALRQRLEEKTAAIYAETPKILAFSVSVWNHKATLELLQVLEKELAKTDVRPVIILGGPELTPLSPAAEIFHYADFVIRGEGENIFAELCRAVLEDKETALKRYGKFITVNNVDVALIRHGYDLYSDEDLEHKLIYVESSRDCPYDCAFCQSAVRKLPGVREFSPEHFLGNLERLLQRSIKAGRTKTKTIKFLDRSFNVNIPRALRILEFCLKNKDGFQFHFEMVPLIFPGELRQILVKFPPETIRLEVGIQSFNRKTCELINRAANIESELEVLRFLREKTSVILHIDLIAGLPGEDLESFGKGFDLLWITLSAEHSAALFEIQPGILKILPGTPIHAMAEESSFIVQYNKNPPYEVIETDCLPVQDMEKIKNFARFWETIVNRGAFPLQLPLLVPPGMAVFKRFMELSQKLFERFGKNFGIPKQELENALKAFTIPE